MEVEEFLEHFGVPGMRWGVRRVRRNEAVGRAARGEGGIATKVRSAGNLARAWPVTAVDLARTGSFKGAAKRKFDRTVARQNRIKAGEGHVRDYIIKYGSTRVTDFLPMRRSKAARPSTAMEDKRIVAARGALWTMQYLGRKASQRQLGM